MPLPKVDPFYFDSVSPSMSSTSLLCILAYLLVTVHVDKVDDYVYGLVAIRKHYFLGEHHPQNVQIVLIVKGGVDG